MRAALENGCNVWNGAEFYGTPEYNSMTLLKHYFTKYPEDADKVFLVIKGGHDLDTHKPNGTPEGVRRSLDNIISQLGGTKKVDAFACSRRDPNVPLEETFSIIQKEYIDTGKIGGISLSECSAQTIHDAAKITKVVAVEVELSMFSIDILRNGVAEACAEHDIPVLAYAPIGRGVSKPSFMQATSVLITIIDAFWSIQGCFRVQGIGHCLHHATLPARSLPAQPQARQRGRGSRQEEGLHPSPAGNCLGEGS